MDWILEKIVRYPRTSAVVVPLVLVIGVGLFWWFAIWQSPQRVFDDMLANNLSTMSVTKSALAGTTQQGVEQTVRLQMGSTNAGDWIVAARQSGSAVTTESIGTTSAGYIRYTQIATPQKASTGKQFDFSSVLNKWGKSDGKTDASLENLFAQTLLDITSAPLPPIANLPVEQRENILDYMKEEKIFSVDYAHVKREIINGRSVYTYQVKVQLGACVRMMQAFAHDLGLTGLDTVDPSQYSTIPPLTMELSVDRASHELVQARYASSGFTQTYRDWGLMTPTPIPHAVLTTTELQGRIQTLSSGQ